MAGSARIGALHVALGLDSAQFESGLKKSQAKLGTFGGELQKGFSDAAGKAGILGSALSGMGVAGLGAAVALGGVAAAMVQARKAMGFADEIGDTAAKLAISTRGLQEYRYAIHQLGGDYADADRALEEFSKAFGAAHAGLTKKAAKPFEALGLDPKQFADTESALRAVTGKISQLGSAAEQAAIADKLGLTPMLPALREGTERIDELRGAASRLGFVMDDALIQKAGAANDKLEDLSQIVDVQLNSAFVDMAPLVVGMAQAFAGLAGFVADAAEAVRGYNDAAAAGAMGQGLRSPLGQEIDAFMRPGAKVDVSGMAPKIGTVLIPPAARGGGGKSGPSEAERARAAALKAANDEIERGVESAKDYVEGLEKQRDEAGKTKAELILMGAATAAAAARTLAAKATTAEQTVALLAYADSIEKVATGLAVQAAATTRVQALGEGLKVPDQFTGKLEKVEGFTGKLGESAEDMQRAFDRAFGDVAGGIDDLYYGLKNKNWAGAARGLIDAGRSISAAFKGGSTGGKIGAVAGAADAVGNMIGGSAGSALSGAASGAMIGLQLGGPFAPIAAGIGAVVGGIAGLFGASSAKKKAKAEAEARAREEAAAKALQIANASRAEEIAYIRMTQGDVAALAEQRKDELAEAQALDPALADLIKRRHEEEDRLDAAAKALALASERRALEIRDLRALGDEQAAAALEREDLLAGVSEENRAYAQLVLVHEAAAEAAQEAKRAADDALAAAQDRQSQAEDALRDAFEHARDEIVTRRDLYRGLADALTGFGETLAAVTGGVGAQTEALAAQFGGVDRRARLGDAEAMGMIPELGRAWADANARSAKSQVEVDRVQADIRIASKAAADTALRQVDVQEEQLAALEGQVGMLIEVRDAVLGVPNAIAALLAAQQGVMVAEAGAGVAAAGPGSGVSQNGSVLSWNGHNIDLTQVAPWIARNLASAAAGGAAELDGAALDAMRSIGATLPGFATGGVGKVGGPSGVDAVLTRMNTTAGEFVAVSHEDPMATVAGLSNHIAGLERRMEQVIVNTGKAGRALDRAVKFGMPVRAVDPSQPIQVEAA